nr:KilA-N domain-containing protein [Serratia symbiotica]
MNSTIAIDNVAIRQDLQGRYCLNDLHRAAGGQEGHAPKYWLNLQQSQEIVHILSGGGFPHRNKISQLA